MLLLIFSKELESLLCHLDVLVPEFSSSYPQVQLGNHMDSVSDWCLAPVLP